MSGFSIHPPNTTGMPLPTNDYVIFSMQRSSSTTLCSDMNRHGLSCLYELLNFGVNQSGFLWQQRLGVTTDFLLTHPEQFVQRVRDAFAPSTGFGYKVFPGQVRAVLLDKLVTPNITCVIYKRENITAQYMSWKRATAAGCWSTSGDPRCHEAHVDADDAELASFARTYHEWYTTAETVCCARAGRIIRGTMESNVLSTQIPSPASPTSFKHTSQNRQSSGNKERQREMAAAHAERQEEASDACTQVKQNKKG